MATCATCKKLILFGGVKEEGFRFCGVSCRDKGYPLIYAEKVPDQLVDEQAARINRGQCPLCNDVSPVDVHKSHRVYSVVLMTSWSSRSHVCCRSCGRKKQLGDILFSFFLGWWGFPFGLVVTPQPLISSGVISAICSSNSSVEEPFSGTSIQLSALAAPTLRGISVGASE